MVSDRHAFEKLISGFPMDLPLPTSKHRTSSIDYNILGGWKCVCESQHSDIDLFYSIRKADSDAG